ncbi:MAG: MFS transporter [Roseovarius sp.]
MPLGRREIWIYLTGLLAAAQMGKMPPLMPLISPELGLSLLAGAIVISLIELGGAVFGAPAAGLAARCGEWRTLSLGLVLLTAGSLAEALSGTGPWLTAARVAESAGYLAVIVSAPVLMAREATRLSPGLALVVWSTFFPAGLGLGTILSGALAAPLGWRGVLLFWALAGLALWLCAPRDRADAGPIAAITAFRPSGASLVLAAGFGGFTCFHVGILALMPEFLISQKGATPGLAGLVTGLGGFVTITGIAVPLCLRHRPVLRLSPLLLGGCLLLPAALLFGVFSPAAPLATSAALFIALNLLAGIFPALAFGAIPRFAGPGGLGPANGALAQAGAAGSLLGPPAYAAVVSHAGWLPAAGLGLALSLIPLLLLTVLETRDRP